MSPLSAPSAARAPDLPRPPSASLARISSPLAGMLWMALAQSLFAAMNVCVRLSSAHVPWSEVAFVRASIGALVAIAMARARGAPLRIHDRRLSWARSIFGTAALICLFSTMGAPAITLGDVATFGALSPIFVALLAPRLLGEPGGRRVWIATAIAFPGVALVAAPTFRLAGHLAAIAVMGAFFSAMAMIWLRRLGGAGSGGDGERRAPLESPEAIVVHFSLVAAFVTGVIAAPTLQLPDAGGAAMLGLTGILGGLAQITMTRAYALERASRLGAIGYWGIVGTHILGGVVLGEAPGAYQVVGAVMIVGGGAFLAAMAIRDARLDLA